MLQVNMGFFGRKSVDIFTTNFAVNWTFHPEQHEEIRLIVRQELKRLVDLCCVDDSELVGRKPAKLDLILNQITQTLPLDLATKISTELIQIGQSLEMQTGAKSMYFGYGLCGAFIQASAEVSGKNLFGMSSERLVKTLLPLQKVKDLISIVLYGETFRE